MNKILLKLLKILSEAKQKTESIFGEKEIISSDVLAEAIAERIIKEKEDWKGNFNDELLEAKDVREIKKLIKKELKTPLTEVEAQEALAQITREQIIEALKK
jgi:hypothetical protein